MCTLADIVNRLGGELLVPTTDAIAIERVYCSDKMSRLLAAATEGTLLVTHMAHIHLIRVAALMDAPAICIAGGARPAPELLSTAAEHSKALVVSPWSVDETLDRLSREGLDVARGDAA